MVSQSSVLDRTLADFDPEVAEQIERELVTREAHRRNDGTSTPAHVVRIGFRCNQACHFCFVSTHLPAPPRARVEAAIDEIAALRGRGVV